jgi:hypothetical protein
MKTTTAALVALLVAGSAWAQGPGPGPGPDNPAGAEQWQKRARLMRTLAIADALGLDDAGTLRLNAQLAQYEDRRHPLQQQLFAESQTLRRAARGDTTAFGQVDGAIQKILALKTQLDQLDRSLFSELSAGLPPQKKAALALAMARLPEQMREMARGKGRR